MQQGGVSQTSSPDSMSGFHVVHAVRGRTRIRVDSPELLATLAQTIERFFAEHPGLQEMRVNSDCLSVVVTYDPDAIHIEVPVSLDAPEGWTVAALEVLARPREVVGDLTTSALSTARGLLLTAAQRWNRSAPGWLALPGPATNGRLLPRE